MHLYPYIYVALTATIYTATQSYAFHALKKANKKFISLHFAVPLSLHFNVFYYLCFLPKNRKGGWPSHTPSLKESDVQGENPASVPSHPSARFSKWDGTEAG